MMRVVRMNREEWLPLAEKAHSAVFHEHRPKEWERIDFALLVTDTDSDRVYGYVTCIEMDPDTIYWQFGGAFRGTKDTYSTFRAYEKMITWTEDAGYKRIGTRIENENVVMLKMAMKVGFRVVGIRNYAGVFLELLNILKR